jgi:hypothetical protein
LIERVGTFGLHGEHGHVGPGTASPVQALQNATSEAAAPDGDNYDRRYSTPHLLYNFVDERRMPRPDLWIFKRGKVFVTRLFGHLACELVGLVPCFAMDDNGSA